MAENIVQFRIPLISQLDLHWHWRKLLMIWGREKSVYVQSPCKLKRNCTLILLIPCIVSNPFFFNLLFNFSPQWSKIDFWSWTLVFKMWSPIRSNVTFFPFETWKDFTDFNWHVSLFLLQLSFPKFQLHLWGIWVMEEKERAEKNVNYGGEREREKRRPLFLV